MNTFLKYILITLFIFLFIYIILKNISKIFIDLEGFSIINVKNPGIYLTKSENYINDEFRKLKETKRNNYTRWIYMKKFNLLLKRYKKIRNRFKNKIKRHEHNKNKFEKKKCSKKYNRCKKHKKKKCSKKYNRCKKHKKKNIKIRKKIKKIKKKIKKLKNNEYKYVKHIRTINPGINPDLKKIRTQIRNTNWEKIRRRKTYKNSKKSEKEYSIVKLVYDHWNKYVKKFITSNNFYNIINNEDYYGREIKKGDYILYTDNINNATNMNISLTQNNYNKIFNKIKDGNKNKSNDTGEIISQYLPDKNIYKIDKIVNNTINLVSNFDNNEKKLTIIPNSIINKIYYSNGFAKQNIDPQLHEFKTSNNKSIYFFLIHPENKQKTINSSNLLYSVVIN